MAKVLVYHSDSFKEAQAAQAGKLYIISNFLGVKIIKTIDKKTGKATVVNPFKN